MSRNGCFILTIAAGMLLNGYAGFGAEEPSRIYLHKGWADSIGLRSESKWRADIGRRFLT